MSNVRHVDFRPRGPTRRAGPVVLITAVAVFCFWVGIYVGWKWHASQPVEQHKPSLDAAMLQINDYMRNDAIRGAWRSVYCDKETEMILSSPIKQEDLK